MQGYGALSDPERKSLWLGLRFSPMLCFAGIALGTVLASPALLFAMALTALLGGFVTAKHPFDYFYDAAVRPLLGGPSVPLSPPPRRFACRLATFWVAAIALAFAAGAATLAWVLAVPLLLAAATVTTTNWCLPSLIYGLLQGSRGWRAEAPLKAKANTRRRHQWQTESE
jgi:hypothetical protein